jgi:hypothetical protein
LRLGCDGQIGGLSQLDPDRLGEALVELGLAGEVLELAHDHPAPHRRRLRSPEQEPGHKSDGDEGRGGQAQGDQAWRAAERAPQARPWLVGLSLSY